MIIEINSLSFQCVINVRHKIRVPTEEFVMLLMGSINVTASVQITMDQGVKQVQNIAIYVGGSSWVEFSDKNICQ